MMPIDPSDDLKFALMPNWFNNYWTYPRESVLVLLGRLLARQKLPTFSIFLGPPASGKSITAYSVGRWASCCKMAAASDTPCGECAQCRAVRPGGDDWSVSSFREINPAKYKTSEEGLDAIQSALGHVRNYGRRPSFDGVRPRNLIFLINEAQRLTKPQKAALLTDLEALECVHVLAATTDIKAMQIERERPWTEDPLISRGTVFQFDFPLIQEAADGLRRDAPKGGLSVTAVAAIKIAQRNRIAGDPTKASPRRCIEDLQLLSALGETIDVDEVATLPGPKAESHEAIQGSAALPDDGGDDDAW